MKTYRATLAVLPFLLCAPALGQDFATMEMQSSGLTASEAMLVSSTSSRAVSVSGTVTGAPESVRFSGNATVASRLAKDPDFNRSSYVLSIDLRTVGGVGASTGAKYVISGPEIVIRNVAPSHAIEITFPFKSASSGLRTGVASFALDFDTATGGMTAASGNVSSPQFP